MRDALTKDAVLPAGEPAVIRTDKVADMRLERPKLFLERGRDGCEMRVVFARDQEDVGIRYRCVVGDDVEVAPLVQQIVPRVVAVAEGAIAVVKGTLVGHMAILAKSEALERRVLDRGLLGDVV